MAVSSKHDDDLILQTLSGPDAANFLQGYVTCDVEMLALQAAMPMAFTSLKGRVIANGWIFGSPSEVRFIVHQSVVESLGAHLSKYLVFSKSTIVEGVRSSVHFSASGSSGVTLKPFDWIVEALRQQPKSNGQPSLAEAAVTREFAIVTKSTTDRFLPQMLGLTAFETVSYSKGCYLGQEIVARAEHRGVVKRRLRRYSWVGKKPYPGQEFDRSGANNTVIMANDTQALVVGTSDDAILNNTHCELTLVQSN